MAITVQKVPKYRVFSGPYLDPFHEVYNVIFYIHPLICLYMLVGVLLVLRLYTYKERFLFCISLAWNNLLFVYSYKEALD